VSNKTQALKDKIKTQTNRNPRHSLMPTDNEPNTSINNDTNDNNIHVTKEDNDKVNNTDQVFASENNTDTVDIFDSILNDVPKNDKIQTGIYFDKDVKKALDKLVKKKKQSEFVNAAVKMALKSKGML
jgi:hypothetical protein